MHKGRIDEFEGMLRSAQNVHEPGGLPKQRVQAFAFAHLLDQQGVAGPLDGIPDPVGHVFSQRHLVRRPVAGTGLMQRQCRHQLACLDYRDDQAGAGAQAGIRCGIRRRARIERGIADGKYLSVAQRGEDLGVEAGEFATHACKGGQVVQFPFMMNVKAALFFIK